MDDLTALRAAFGRLRALAPAGPDDLGRPTPCAEWDVRALLDHVVAGQSGLVAVLAGDVPDWSERDRLGDDPAGAVDRALDAALDAFSGPGAVDATSEKLPGLRIVDFAAADAVVHGWDLATALGRPLDPPPTTSCGPCTTAGPAGPPRRGAPTAPSARRCRWPTTGRWSTGWSAPSAATRTGERPRGDAHACHDAGSSRVPLVVAVVVGVVAVLGVRS